MSLRRYSPMKQSMGTTWPREVREAAMRRDKGCIGPRIGMPGLCVGEVELDHVRASGGIGMKSRSTLDNAASLCAAHHRLKTNEGRTWRPKILLYLEVVSDPHAHCVDPCGLDCIARMPPQ